MATAVRKQKTTKTAPEPRKATPENRAAPREIALDLGNIKCAMAFDGQVVMWPSITAPLTKANRIGNLPAEHTLIVDDQLIVYGEMAKSISPDTVFLMNQEGRYTSDWYVSMFRYALHRAYYQYIGEGIIFPRIISSVPAFVYKEKALVQKIMNKLIGDHEIVNSDGQNLYISVGAKSLTIVPEGVGAYWNKIYGKCPGDYKKGVWITEDYGNLTLDSCVMINGHYAGDRAHSDGECGMGKVIEAIQGKILLDADIQLRADEVDELIKNRVEVKNINGVDVQIKPVRDAKIQEIAERADNMRKQWYRGLDIAGILRTGGGSLWIAQHLKYKPAEAYMVDDPVSEGVKGAYEHLMATRV